VEDVGADGAIGSEVVSQLHGQLEKILGELRQMASNPTGVQAYETTQRLQAVVSRLGDPKLADGSERAAAVEDMRGLLGDISESLRELRRQTSVGATPS
jgi:hypothetical protein